MGNVMVTNLSISGNIISPNSLYTNVLDYGANVSLSDNTSAFLAAFNAVSSGSVIFIPAGIYNFSQSLIFSDKKVSWVGAGSSSSILLYTGANTTNDCFVWGDNVSEVNQIEITGIGFKSSTKMTAGAGVHFRLLTRSNLQDVTFGTQDDNPLMNFYHGVWFDGVDLIHLNTFQCWTSGDGLRVNGKNGSGTVGPRADLFISHGKIGQCTVGVHIGGGFGGFYLDSTDVIGNGTNMLIDYSIVPYANRETFVGAGALFDGAGNSLGVNIDVQDTSGFILFTGSWNGSTSILVRVGSNFYGSLSWIGGILVNAFNTGGIGVGNVPGVAQMFRQYGGVVRVVVRQVAVRPAPEFFQPLRQIPVIDRAEGPHAVCEHRIDQSAVVVDSLHVRRARSGWLNAWP